MRFLCLGMKENEGLYSSGGENMNERPFNEGLTKNHKPRPHFSIWGNLMH